MQQNPLTEFESLFSTLSGGRQAALDVSESDTAFVIRIDLPGYDEDDIDIRLTDHTLHVHAEREAESESGEGESYIRRERSHHAISRTIELPGTIDEDAASATYEDGVLEITLRKEAEPETEEREIAIA